MLHHQLKIHPSSQIFQFLSQAQADKNFKAMNYKIMRERAFDCLNLGGYKALVEMLMDKISQLDPKHQQVGWLKKNRLFFLKFF